jgi:hypothetical protein
MNSDASKPSFRAIFEIQHNAVGAPAAAARRCCVHVHSVPHNTLISNSCTS